MTTREQDLMIDKMASAYGGVRVMRLPSQSPGTTPEGATDVVAVPWVDGQVAAPVFVPHDVGEVRLARAATASEIARAQAWAQRRRDGDRHPDGPCDSLSLPTAVSEAAR